MFKQIACVAIFSATQLAYADIFNPLHIAQDAYSAYEAKKSYDTAVDVLQSNDAADLTAYGKVAKVTQKIAQNENQQGQPIGTIPANQLHQMNCNQLIALQNKFQQSINSAQSEPQAETQLTTAKSRFNQWTKKVSSKTYTALSGRDIDTEKQKVASGKEIVGEEQFLTAIQVNLDTIEQVKSQKQYQ